MQPGNPGQDPYGQQPPYGDPTSSPPANPYSPPPANPYAPPPANPYTPPVDPYSPAADPYAPSESAPADPYGQQPVSSPPPVSPAPHAPYSPAPHDPYSSPPANQPPAYGQPNYGQPAYGQPTYGQPPMSGQPYGDPYAAQQSYGGGPMYPQAGFAAPGGQQNTLGLVSMILGIAAIPLFCCYLGIPLGAAALITGWLGKQKADQGLASNSGQALAGMICGGVGVLLGLLQIVLLVINISLPTQL
ncbi:DUF4190 domain-containing protein [Micromonospora sp. NPDC048871]|uniref:DUF4190 domain-containing protein n=1 Tax=unclassified Micromonospora TaxID=2617518 RepID=UPI002E13499F|nr:DUF4190 domain-containing protein [Micromonospora sp. NBC_01739]